MPVRFFNDFTQLFYCRNALQRKYEDLNGMLEQAASLEVKKGFQRQENRFLSVFDNASSVTCAHMRSSGSHGENMKGNALCTKDGNLSGVLKILVTF